MNKEVKKYMSELGHKSAAALSPEQRKERAKKAIETRWAKNATVKKSCH